MNTNHKKRHIDAVERARNTKFGRVVCRVFGEETGAVMMEYVIVATLIAAAVAVGAWLFGADLVKGFNWLADFVRGDHDAGKAKIEKADTDRPAQDAAAINAGKDLIKAGDAEDTVNP